MAAGDEPYYPINDERNTKLYEEYAALAEAEGDVVFAGRLGGYKYYDMDKAIAAAFDLVKAELGVDLMEGRTRSRAALKKRGDGRIELICSAICPVWVRGGGRTGWTLVVNRVSLTRYANGAYVGASPILDFAID